MAKFRPKIHSVGFQLTKTIHLLLRSSKAHTPAKYFCYLIKISYIELGSLSIGKDHLNPGQLIKQHS